MAAGMSMPVGRSVKTRVSAGRRSGFDGCVISKMIDTLDLRFDLWSLQLLHALNLGGFGGGGGIRRIPFCTFAAIAAKAARLKGIKRA